jgi:hypothetical protein
MKIYSNLAIAKIFLGIILLIWLVTLLIIMVNNCLSCVDENGCLRSSCKYSWLRPEYKKIILQNANNCPFQEYN